MLKNFCENQEEQAKKVLRYEKNSAVAAAAERTPSKEEKLRKSIKIHNQLNSEVYQKSK